MRCALPRVLWAVLLAAAALRAQEGEPEAGLVALRQACLDACSDIVVLNVAAHPDDESSRTNTMLRRRHGMRVVTVYATYGDGGQNAIGREIGPELADLRVRETLRAAALSGVEVRWLGMPDFGFSKTLEETLRVWGGDELKQRMRLVLDSVDPDVVITNHSLTQGHGHHRASFWAVHELLQERAAKGGFVPRLLSRCGVDKAQVTFDPNEVDAARGETFARLAYRAWTQHVTQGPWPPHDPLQVGKDYWQLVPMEGLVVGRSESPATWGREVPGGAFGPLDPTLLPPSQLHAEARARLVQTRDELRAVVRNLDGEGAIRRARLLRRRAQSLERVLLALANVRTEVWLESDTVARGQTGKAFVIVHGFELLTDLQVGIDGTPGVLIPASTRATPFDGMPRDDAATTPPLTLPTVPSGRYRVEFECVSEEGVDATAPPALEPELAEVTITFTLDGLPFELLVARPYTPVPTMELKWDREVLLVPKGQRRAVRLSASVRTNRDSGINTAVRLSMGLGIEGAAMPPRLTLTRQHEEARILVDATIDADELQPDASLGIGFREASARLPIRVVDVTVPAGMKVALVRGPDDTTEHALADLGVPYVALDRDALVATTFDGFTAVLLDIRAYHHREELAEVRDQLLRYCRAGGRVVVMYHKPNEWNEGNGHPSLAPFPLTVGHDRVTEENAAVTFLLPGHRLLSEPHRLDATDFADWVQERGLNFPKAWDPAWAPLLAMQDSGDEKPLTGALLYTQCGRGDFVYCSLALYRQLRVGNPGAARLLVNLLAR
ncbi:MAG: PIG-L family deacetylase [Planctomycetes bacterium]|nr:PIG-L family deacetylase [Planctomycetota bacterium]